MSIGISFVVEVRQHDRWGCVLRRTGVADAPDELEVASVPDLPDEFPHDGWWDTNNDPAFDALYLIGDDGADEHGDRPRGLPLAVSNVAATYHADDPEPVGTTWLSLEELLRFDWNKKEERHCLLISNGRVPKRHLDPEAARRHVARFGIQHVPHGWMAVGAHGNKKKLEVAVTWQEPRSSVARSFMPVLVDLVKLERRSDVDSVRVIFWFSN